MEFRPVVTKKVFTGNKFEALEEEKSNKKVDNYDEGSVMPQKYTLGVNGAYDPKGP